MSETQEMQGFSLDQIMAATAQLNAQVEERAAKSKTFVAAGTYLTRDVNFALSKYGADGDFPGHDMVTITHKIEAVLSGGDPDAVGRVLFIKYFLGPDAERDEQRQIVRLLETSRGIVRAKEDARRAGVADVDKRPFLKQVLPEYLSRSHGRAWKTEVKENRGGDDVFANLKEIVKEVAA